MSRFFFFPSRKISQLVEANMGAYCVHCKSSTFCYTFAACMCLGCKFAAHNPLRGGHDTKDSQHGIRCDSVASTHTGVTRTDRCHGMKHLCSGLSNNCCLPGFSCSAVWHTTEVVMLVIVFGPVRPSICQLCNN